MSYTKLARVFFARNKYRGGYYVLKTNSDTNLITVIERWAPSKEAAYAWLQNKGTEILKYKVWKNNAGLLSKRIAENAKVKNGIFKDYTLLEIITDEDI